MGFILDILGKGMAAVNTLCYWDGYQAIPCVMGISSGSTYGNA